MIPSAHTIPIPQILRHPIFTMPRYKRGPSVDRTPRKTSGKTSGNISGQGAALNVVVSASLRVRSHPRPALPICARAGWPHTNGEQNVSMKGSVIDPWIASLTVVVWAGGRAA